VNRPFPSSDVIARVRVIELANFYAIVNEVHEYVMKEAQNEMKNPLRQVRNSIMGGMASRQSVRTGFFLFSTV
jgi:hypothetical protein